MKLPSLIALMVGALGLSAQATGSETPHWGYSGTAGPDHWSQLAPEFAACSAKNQSPINLTGFIEAQLPPIKLEYSATGKELVNNGHTEQLNFQPGSSIAIDGIHFELKQLHFHAASENQINGKSFPLEAHLVHADKAGNLAVIAILFEDGNANQALEALWSRMPEKTGEKVQLEKAFSAERLLPADRDYYRYDGSLTTPPCTEGVRWLVLKKPVSASHEQVEHFAHLMHHPNNRPVQPVNARTVLQ